MSDDDYRQGRYDGMKNALRIVRETQAADQTRCTERQFQAAKGRIVRRLAGAVARNEPEPAGSSVPEQPEPRSDEAFINQCGALRGDSAGWCDLQNDHGGNMHSGLVNERRVWWDRKGHSVDFGAGVPEQPATETCEHGNHGPHPIYDDYFVAVVAKCPGPGLPVPATEGTEQR